MNILYPNTGGPLDDAAVLINAVDFSTGARAHNAQLILQQPLSVGRREVSFLAIEAFA